MKSWFYTSKWGIPHNVFGMTIRAMWVSLETGIYVRESRSKASVPNCTYRNSSIVIAYYYARSILQHKIWKCQKSRPNWCGMWYAILILGANTVFWSRWCMNNLILWVTTSSYVQRGAQEWSRYPISIHTKTCGEWSNKIYHYKEVQETWVTTLERDLNWLNTKTLTNLQPFDRFQNTTKANHSPNTRQYSK